MPDAPSTHLARLLGLPVAWGVLLFGAVYPWVYGPLLLTIGGIGAFGWLTAPDRNRRPVRSLAAWLGVLAGVIILQLVPLPASVLTVVSPATDRFVRQIDLAYESSRVAGTGLLQSTSIAPQQTLKGLAFFLALSVFLVGTTAMMPRVPIRKLLRWLAALGLLVAVFGIVQRATFNDRLYWVFEPIYSASNAFGPFVNRNHFAGWMVMMAAVTAGYVCSLIVPLTGSQQSWRDGVVRLSARDGRRFLFTTCGLAVMAVSIVWTFSRSGMLALAVCTMLLAAHVFARFHGRRRLVSMALLFGVVGVALALKGPTSVVDAFGRTSTLEWRMLLWRDTLAIMRDFPWLGTGLNTYGASTVVYPATDRITHAMEAHNDYIQIVSEGGLLLALAAAGAIWQLTRAIRAALAEPQTQSLYWIRLGATVGLVAMAVQELVDFSLQIPANAVLFTLLAAIAIHRTPRHERPDDHPSRRAVTPSGGRAMIAQWPTLSTRG